MNKEEYRRFCVEIEQKKGYDGRGTYDVYVCKTCGRQFLTTYKHKGVTPFTIKCKGCGGLMVHTETFDHPVPILAVHRWVRPTYEQYTKLSDGLKGHVECGGLVLEDDL